MGNILNVKTSAADDISTLVLFTLRVQIQFLAVW